MSYQRSPERRLWKILIPAALAACVVHVPQALAQDPAAAPAPVEPKGPPRREKVYHNDDRFKFNLPAGSLNNDPSKLNQVLGLVRNSLKGEYSLSENKSFDLFYTQYLFPLMTLTDESELVDLPKKRNQFFRDHLVYCKSNDVHQHLVDLTFTEMRRIAQEDYHPAVRYNAMYIIAQLNTTEPSTLGVKSIPDPYSPALPWLLDMFKKDETPEALKVGALLGVVRHLEWDNYRSQDRKMAAAQRTDAIKTLTALVQSATPPEGRSVAAHNWLRRRGIEGLGFAGFLNPEQGIVSLLCELIENDKESTAVRADAAQTLGLVNLMPPVKVDVKPMTESLVRLAMASVESESARLDELQKQDKERVRVKASAGMAGSGGNYGGSGGYDAPTTEMPMGSSGMSGKKRQRTTEAPQPEDTHKYRSELAMRRVRANLHAVEYALLGGDSPRYVRQHEKLELNVNGSKPVRGLASLAKAPAEKELISSLVSFENNKLTGLLADLEKVAEEQEPDYYSFKKDFKDPLRALTAKVKVTAPAAVEEPASDEPDLPVAPAKGKGKGPAKAAPAAPVPADEEPVAAAVPAKPAAKVAAEPGEEAMEDEPTAPAKAPAAKAPPAPGPDEDAP